jgi:hypothetical protein
MRSKFGISREGKKSSEGGGRAWFSDRYADPCSLNNSALNRECHATAPLNRCGNHTVTFHRIAEYCKSAARNTLRLLDDSENDTGKPDTTSWEYSGYHVWIGWISISFWQTLLVLATRMFRQQSRSFLKGGCNEKRWQCARMYCSLHFVSYRGACCTPPIFTTPQFTGSVFILIFYRGAFKIV